MASKADYAALWRRMDWAYAQTLPMAEKSLLVTLAWHCRDKAPSCYPSAARLLQLTGLSKNTLPKAMGELQRLALVSVEARVTPDGRRTSNRITLRLPQEPTTPPNLGGTPPQKEPPYTPPNLGGLEIEDQIPKYSPPAASTRARVKRVAPTDEDVEALRTLWNTGKAPEQQAWTHTSPARAKEAKKRLTELPLDEWPPVIAAIAGARWLAKHPKYPPAGADFLLKDTTWQRALEGGLADRKQQFSNANDMRLEIQRRNLEHVSEGGGITVIDPLVSPEEFFKNR